MIASGIDNYNASCEVNALEGLFTYLCIALKAEFIKEEGLKLSGDVKSSGP